MLLWAGKLVDRVSLKLYSTATIAGLACATFVMSQIEGTVGLILAFFLLRFFGQGLMIHSAMTAMGRYFAAERGRAVSFSLTGHVLGGAALPLLGVTLIGSLTWHRLWLASGVALVIIAMPVVWLLLSKAQTIQTGASAASLSSHPGKREPIARQHWTQAEVLRDLGFYVRLSVLLAPAFITTGFIFHQAYIGAQKGWSLTLIASALSAYAIGSFAATLFTGQVVDKFSARRIVPLALIPIALACFLWPLAQSALGALLFFGLMGLGTGLVQVLTGAIWPELYGTRHLGAIRALAACGSVFSSGLAPGIFGLLLDQQWSANTIATSCGGYCVATSIMAGWYSRRTVQRSRTVS